jgi:hypothetical protein
LIGPLGPVEIKVLADFLAFVKFLVEFFSFHRVLSPPFEIA